MEARINSLFTCLFCPLNMDVKVGLSQSLEDEDESDSKRKREIEQVLDIDRYSSYSRKVQE